MTGASPGLPIISVATAAVKIAEAAPVFTSVTITGIAKIGVTLTAAGIGYSDINGDTAATPLYQWAISDAADGTYADIPDAVSSTYTPLSADLDKFIKVVVTPAALTGTTPGLPMTSAATTAVKIAEAAPTFTSASNYRYCQSRRNTYSCRHRIQRHKRRCSSNSTLPVDNKRYRRRDIYRHFRGRRQRLHACTCKFRKIH